MSALAVISTMLVGLLAVAQAEVVRIAVASNFKPAMDELELVFEEQSGHDLLVSAGSTGKLYAQIINGAPYDVFLSADQERPRRLVEVSRAQDRFTYAVGRIVLLDPIAKSAGPDRLEQMSFRRLAIANPELAPYGQAARQVLTTLGLFEALQDRIVLGENIGQTYAFIWTGNAELGFVALSQLDPEVREQTGLVWIPPQESSDPIRQDAVLLRHGGENAAATDFINFLKSEKAKALIRGHGYETE
ncbi:molybdate ABC transporter substrate-binding protein [Parvularcula marina]|uniref:Molybdate ABC transporter substrate-binding protein n=2 Tax=Parvularcula marina TaxID=2292771 RepID=A0A371RLU1_9PROT|nr:molybdate ABC transporter substrate-binding protein [Parvularcula marina]